MKNKKAEVSQVFTYISTAIIVVLVVGFGVMWISNLLSNVSEIECVKFKTDLERRIRTNLDFGKIDTRPLRVDCDFREICFITDPLLEPITYNENTGALDYIINTTYSANVPQNVFFVNQVPESFFYLEKLEVKNNKQCFNVTNLGIDIRLEGKGNKVMLSKNQG